MCTTPITTLSTVDVAKAVGVSESSVKRWVDSGELSASRTPGGHRKIALADLDQFIAKRKLSLVAPQVVGIPADIKATTDSASIALLADAIAQGGRLVVQGFVRKCVMAGWSYAKLADELLLPAYKAVRDDCTHPSEECIVLHRGIQVIREACEQSRQTTNRTSPSILFADVGYDVDGLAVFLAETAVYDLGKTHQLGSSVPFTVIQGALSKEKPDALWLSASGPQPGKKVRTDIAALVNHAEDLGIRTYAFGSICLSIPSLSPSLVANISEFRGAARGL